MIARHRYGDAEASAALRWFQPLLAYLRTVPNDPDPRLQRFFRDDAPLLAARAPGRLDVMGGIADYSGSLVLEWPLARATFAVVQAQAAPVCSFLSVRDGQAHVFHIDLAALQAGALREAEALRLHLAERVPDRWAAYVAGVVHYCLHRLGGSAEHPTGFRMLIRSDVPEGKGVSSSAALEVAAMAALTACYDLDVDPEALASACQWVENHIVGAPCGIMDQMTSACGRQDHLLRLHCQPAVVEGHVAVPAGYQFCGIDSGIRHAVTGADYGTVRTAAFMGYRIIAEAAGLPMAEDEARLRIRDVPWRGYLANISPREYEARFRSLLPECMDGSDFLARYGGIPDAVTRVDPKGTYPVRQATAHPIYEHARVRRFARLLRVLPRRETAALEMGRLMLASHASYSACGLGSDGTDRLVEMVRRLGPEQGFFGAKITGGGSGGTVAIFSTHEAAAQVDALAARYRAETGRPAEVFVGSSPGAAEVGLLAFSLVHRSEKGEITPSIPLYKT